ncbi:hypothetical protein MRX96_046779, partial [Rhipicephalus microplus]
WTISSACYPIESTPSPTWRAPSWPSSWAPSRSTLASSYSSCSGTAARGGSSFPLVVIYAALYLVFGGLAYLFLGLSGTVADRVRTLGSIMDTVSVGDVSDSAFSYMKVHEHDCRLRFVCELSEKAVQRDHMFALVLRIVSVLGSAGGPYVEAVLGGLSGRGCHLLFADCDYSPLRRSLPFLD